jgi:carboxypeptidase PM20D1
MDEGMFLMKGVFPGVAKQMAIVGIAEKGYMTLKFSINKTGGHASFPPKHTVVGQLAQAVTRLENNQHPPGLVSAGPLLNFAGRETPFYLRLVFANLWLFKSILFRFFTAKPELNAMVRTTTAVTMFSGGIKENVLPNYASTTVNHRVAHHQTIEDVLNHDRSVIDDPDVKIDVVSSLPPSPISDTNSYGFKLISHTVKQLHEDTIISPGLMIANTDTRYFWDLTPNIFRFTPIQVSMKELAGIHGRNERISVENYKKLIEFYYHILRNTDMPYDAFH